MQLEGLKWCFFDGYRQRSFIRGNSPLRSNPLAFYVLFLTKQVPLSYTLILLTVCVVYIGYNIVTWETKENWLNEKPLLIPWG